MGIFVPPNTFGGQDPFAPTAPNQQIYNVVKHHVNWNACFLCGFDVEEGHTLATCPILWHKPNHQVGYMRENAARYVAYGPSIEVGLSAPSQRYSTIEEEEVCQL
jgi:hypothetical protein